MTQPPGVSAAPTEGSRSASPPNLAFDRLPELGLGIRVKLIGLMVAMTLVIVLPLAGYFTGRELEELHASTRARAEMYASLASQQLRSAVAFDDRETAREVLGSIAKDPLVDGIAVYTKKSAKLHVEGKQSELARRAAVLSEQPQVYHLPGRVLATAPVRSLEGARGNVVIELSTRSAQAMQRRLTSAALLIGGAALLLGTFMAWLIARSLARRIEAIAEAASAMSRGELSRVIDLKGPNDELGLLSHGFNAMSRKVSELVAHIQRTAREQSERLERLVAQRTEQLNRKNADLRLVLDNVEQGFVTIDREARVVGEYSRTIATWLGELDSRTTLWQQLAGERAELQASFDSAWEQVREDLMPIEVSLDQMPTRMKLGQRELSLGYRALEEAGKVLVVISDVTAVVAREASEQESRDLVNMTTRLLKDHDGFCEFFDESERLMQRVADNRADAVALKRDVHTLKGNSAFYGLSRVASACHELETALEWHSPEAVDRSTLFESWRRCSVTAKRLLRGRDDKLLEVGEGDYLAVLDALRNGTPAARIVRRMEAWRLEPLRSRLDRAAEQLVTLAASLGKGSVAVKVQAPELYLAHEELSEFWSAFSHVVRNAAVHGLRSVDSRERSAQGAGPDFDLLAGIDQDRLFVELADSGPGIDWEGIRRRAKASGFPHATTVDLEEALFLDGVSTRSDVSEIAGRGVGLSAVRSACVRRKGSVRVVTRDGQGTRFRFSWPMSELTSLVNMDAKGARS